MKKKRVLSIILSLSLMVGLIPLMSMTAHATEYPLWVSGIQVNSMYSSGLGWRYDGIDNIIYLDSLYFSDDVNYSFIEYKGDHDLTIVLENTNTINNIANYANPVIKTQGKLIIEGDGILNVSSMSQDAIACNSFEMSNGTVKNAITGTGWTNTQGDEGIASIAVSSAGQTLDGYKKVQFPASVAKVKTKPTAKTLTYTGNEQELVTAGVPENGTMKYALSEDDTTAPTSGYSKAIPTGKDAKTYYVWFKAVGDATHLDSDAECVTVKINPKEPDPPTPPTPPGPKPPTPAPTSRDVMSGGNQVVAYGQPASFEFDIPFGLFQQNGKVYVDGEETDSKNYDAKPGSTIITLKDEFIKTLSEGAHEILVTVEGYEASTSFTVKKADAPNTDNSSSTESGTATASTPTTTTPTSTPTTTSKVTSPKTSDTIPIVAILILALGIGTIGIAAYKKRD